MTTVQTGKRVGRVGKSGYRPASGWCERVDAVMPPTPSKGKQRLGVVSYSYSIPVWLKLVREMPIDFLSDFRHMDPSSGPALARVLRDLNAKLAQGANSIM